MFQLITKKFGHYMGTFNFREEAEAKAAQQWHTEFDIIEFTPKYANECLYTDVNPFEIVKKISDLTYEIRQMKCERDPSFKPEVLVGGFSGHTVNQNDQKWFITSDETRPVFRIRYSRAKGDFFSKHGGRFSMTAEPVKFYDYNF